LLPCWLVVLVVMAVLEVRGLRKRYGRVVAVDGVSFSAGRGVHGLVGPNGAGKTTTLKSIVGLVVPDAGEVLFNGVDLLSPRGWRLRGEIGYVAEVPVLPDDYVVVELLEELALVEGLDRLSARREARRVLEEVGLDRLADRKVRGLSKGERKRLYFAQALLQQRSLYVLDEPFSGLDPEAVAWARSLVSRLGREATVLLSSHLLREVEELAGSVTIIYGGRVLFSGALEELARMAGGGVVAELSVDRPEEAARLLGGEGYEAEASGSRLVVRLDSREDAARVVSLLSSRGFMVYESRLRGRSLEEAYLELIARAARGEKVGA